MPWPEDFRQHKCERAPQIADGGHTGHFPSLRAPSGGRGGYVPQSPRSRRVPHLPGYDSWVGQSTTERPANAAADVYIIGSPRSGTTWLQRLLAALPNVASPQETTLFKYLAPMFETWQHQRRRIERLAYEHENGDSLSDRVVGLPAILTDSDLITVARQMHESVRREALRLSPGAHVFVEKSPDHALFTELINSVVPEAYFVHVIRSPYDAVNSDRNASLKFCCSRSSSS